MRKTNLINIGAVIKKLMRNPKLVDRLEKLDVLDIWKEIIGKDLKQYVTESRIKDNVLYVKVKSSVLKNELSYKKTELIKKINKKIGKKIIKDINLK